MFEGEELQPAGPGPSPLRPVASGAEMLAALAAIVAPPRTSDARPAGEPARSGRALLLVGGADFADAELLASLRSFFAALAAACERTSSAVVDGGTDSGVMRLMAEARAAAGGSFPLVGVMPGGALDRTTSTGGPILPARGHTLVLLVPGSAFGDETEWLFAAADHLAADGAAPAVVVNGGRLSLHEARLRLERGCPVIAVEGSGRAADDLVADAALRASGRLRVIPLSADADAIIEALEDEPQP